MIDLGRNWGSRTAGQFTPSKLSRTGLLMLVSLVWILAQVGAPAARAEIGNTVDFMPQTWKSGGAASAVKESATETSNGARAGVRRSRAAAASYDDGSRPQRRARVTAPVRPERTSVAGGGIAWRASSGCLAGNLRSAIAHVASAYGSVTVNSTCRSPGHNRSVGGAPKSWHLKGEAADIRVHGNYAAASSYLRGQVGGFKHYGGGRFHIDNGPHRTF